MRWAVKYFSEVIVVCDTEAEALLKKQDIEGRWAYEARCRGLPNYYLVSLLVEPV